MLYKLIKDWKNAEGKVLKKGNLKRMDSSEAKELMDGGFILNPDKPEKGNKPKAEPKGNVEDNLNINK